MIVCWFYKKIIAQRVDDNRALPARAQAHVRNCPACRQFYALERELTRRLADDAERHRHAPSPFLHGKIMASLNRRTEIIPPERKSLQPVWAAALIIVVLGLISIPAIRTVPNSHRPSTAKS